MIFFYPPNNLLFESSRQHLIDSIIEELEREQGSLEEVRPEPNLLFINQGSELRVDQQSEGGVKH